MNKQQRNGQTHMHHTNVLINVSTFSTQGQSTLLSENSVRAPSGPSPKAAVADAKIRGKRKFLEPLSKKKKKR